jgi:exodeoxyribonuclease VII large subunit
MIDGHRRFIEGLKTRYGLRSISDRLAGQVKHLEDATSLLERLIKSRVEIAAREAAETLARLERAAGSRVEAERGRLGGLAGRVEALSPLSTLKRGYSVVMRGAGGEVVRTYRQISAGEDLRLVLSEGGAVVKVENVEEVNAYEGTELRRLDEED